jgi:hypothetical protein
MNRYPSPIKQYFDSLKQLITSDPYFISMEILREESNMASGFIQLKVQLIKNASLRIFEYFEESKGVHTYRYQLLDDQNNPIIRWDNAPHHRNLSTFPHHYHYQNTVFESPQYTLQ